MTQDRITDPSLDSEVLRTLEYVLDQVKFAAPNGMVRETYTLLNRGGKAINVGETSDTGNICIIGKSSDDTYELQIGIPDKAEVDDSVDAAHLIKVHPFGSFTNLSLAELSAKITEIAGTGAKMRVREKLSVLDGTTTPPATPDRVQINELKRPTRTETKNKALDALLGSVVKENDADYRGDILRRLNLASRLEAMTKGQRKNAEIEIAGEPWITLERDMRKPRDLEISADAKVDLASIAIDTLCINIHAHNIDEWTGGIPQNAANRDPKEAMVAILADIGWDPNAQSSIIEVARAAGIKQIVVSMKFDKSQHGETRPQQTTLVELDYATTQA